MNKKLAGQEELKADYWSAFLLKKSFLLLCIYMFLKY